MQTEFYKLLERSPIIAAIFNSNDLSSAIASPCEGIFLLSGNICELPSMVEQVHANEKKIYIHLDLIGGLGKDQYAVEYMKETVKPDGIITTKSNIVKYAREFKLFAIQRIFMLDSKSLDVATKTVATADADAIEILPGILPSVISSISDHAKVPVIAGGLLRTKKEVITSINSGAMGISTSCKELWDM